MKVEIFKIADLRQLALRMAKARLDELAITHQGMSVRMRFTPPPLVDNREQLVQEASCLAAPPVEPDNEQPILAQGPGYFLRHHPAHHQDYITPGSTVKTGDVLGVLRMGQIYLPVNSSHDGEVIEVMATESVVEYGQTVVLLKKPVKEVEA